MLCAKLNQIHAGLSPNERLSYAYGDKIMERLARVEQQAGEVFEASWEVYTVKKGEYLLKQGKAARYVWLLLEGVVRECQTEDGKCYVSHFYLPGLFFTNYDSSLNDCPSTKSLQMVTDGQLFGIAWKQLKQLEQRYPVLSELEKLLFNHSTQVRHNLWRERNKQDSITFYKYLMDFFPSIVQEVSNIDLSCYMGINCCSLSRIRRLLSSIL